MPRRVFAASALVLLMAASAHAVIKALTPLQVFVDNSAFIVVAKVEKFFADKPAMILTVEKDLKGKAPFRRLPVNLKVDPATDKDMHGPELLKRLGPDLTVVLFVNQRGKRFDTFAYSNGTWFFILGQKTGDDTVAWSMTHGEPFLRRTFKGTTAEMTTLLNEALAGKTKLPAAADKEKPGFGPEYKPSPAPLPSPSPSADRDAGGVAVAAGMHGGAVFGVIPTVFVGGPFAILAILFPTVFGGVLVLFRQWAGFIAILSVNSLLLMLNFFLSNSFRGTWLSEQRWLWLVMCGVTLAGCLWAWRRQVHNVALGPAAVETPERTENVALAVLSLTLLLVCGVVLWLSSWDYNDVNNRLVLVFFFGAVLALFVKGVRALRRSRSFEVPLSTEGIMLAGILAASLAYVVFQSGDVKATVFQGDAVSDVDVALEGKKRWEFVTPAAGVFVSTPLIHEDRIYAASAHVFNKYGELRCFDRRTGKELWMFDDDGDFKQVYSSPVVADGKLYIGEGFHDDPKCKLYCIDAASGKKLWHFPDKGLTDKPPNGQTESTPAVALGRVYCGFGNEGFFCLDANTGKEAWRFPPKKDAVPLTKRAVSHRLLRFCGNPVVADGRVYIGTGEDRNQPEDKGETAVFCLDAKTGDVVWKLGVNLPCWAAPVLEGNRLYVALGNGDIMDDANHYDENVANAGAVWCVDAVKGEKIWTRAIDNGIINAVVVDETRLYFGSRNGKVSCLSKADGKDLWQTDLGSAVVGSPALARLGDRTESVIALATAGTLNCLDPKTGKGQWLYQIEGQCHTTATPRVELTRKGRFIYVAGALGGTVVSGKAAIFCLEDKVSEKKADE